MHTNIRFENEEIKFLMQFSDKIDKAVNNYIEENTFYELNELYIDIKQQKRFVKSLSLLLSTEDWELIPKVNNVINDCIGNIPDSSENIILEKNNVSNVRRNFDNLYILADLIQKELYANEELKEMWELNFAY